MGQFCNNAIVLAGFMADEYKLRHKLDLNAIEVLTLLEEVSKRYRILLRKRIRLSSKSP